MAKKHSGAQGSTPATVALAKLGIDFEVRSYQHDPSVTDFGREAADILERLLPVYELIVGEKADEEPAEPDS